MTAPAIRPRRRAHRSFGALAAIAATATTLAVATSPAAAAPGDTAWGDPSPLIAQFETDRGGASGLRIDLSADGEKAVASWITYDSASFEQVLHASMGWVEGDDRDWSVPADLSEGPDVRDYDIAISDDGSTVVAAWVQISQDDYKTRVMTSAGAIGDTGVAWSDATEVAVTSVPELINMREPRVDVSADGSSAVVAFIAQNLLSGENIRSASLALDADAEGVDMTMSTVAEISLYGSEAADLSVVIASNGEYAAASWLHEDDAKFVSGAIDGDTQDWHADLTLETGDVAEVRMDLADTAPVATVAWIKDDPRTVSSMTAGLTPIGEATFGPKSDIATSANGFGGLAIDTTDDGTIAVASWQVLLGDTYVATASVDTTQREATWQTPTMIADGYPFGEGTDVAVAGNGASAVMTWIDWRNESDLSEGRVGRTATAALDGTVATWGATEDLSLPDATIENGKALRSALSDTGTTGLVAWSEVVDDGATYVVARPFTMEVVPPPPPGPSAPSDVTVSSIVRGNRSASLQVAVGDDGGAAPTTYQARCVNDGTTRTASGSTRKLTVTKLTNSTTWKCSARARNEGGWSEWSGERNIVPSTKPADVPTAPAIASATPMSSAATITLDKPEKRRGSAIERYQVRCTLGATSVTSDPSTSRTITVVPLTGNQTWKCIGRARNGVGWSTWSAPTKVVPTVVN